MPSLKDSLLRAGIVYSTDPNFQSYDESEEEKVETLPPSRQTLILSMERAGRKGKTVTIVRGFVGQDSDLAALAKWLKTRIGVGGSCKDGEIILQGDWRERVRQLLTEKGYRTKG